MQVSLAAFGGGTMETVTTECAEAIRQAELILGAKRLLEQLPASCGAERMAAIKGEEILSILKQTEKKRCCVLFSGDTGFYSGVKRLLPLLEQAGYAVQIFPGVSSVQLLSARLGRPWQEWHLVSAHGVACSVVGEVMQGKPTFFLTGGAISPNEICRELTKAGLGMLEITVGENLSYPEEKLSCGTAAALAERSFSPLSVLLAEGVPRCAAQGVGLADASFFRGNVPMTKQEVRAAVLGKLAVQPKDIVWDVGAGTGSVSIALSMQASGGTVYAIECQEEACALIEKNREKFCAWNLSLVHGKAPEALRELPPPQAVFIGGTKGNLEEIVAEVLEKNPMARICISAISFETLSQAVAVLQKHRKEPVITQISVSKSKAVGSLHLMLANNPVFLITGGCHE